MTTHHGIVNWIENASPDDEIFFHLSSGSKSGSSQLDPNVAFQELASRDAGFAHAYELLKRAADAHLVELRFKGSCLFIKRLAPN